jgi:hypothetical protein
MLTDKSFTISKIDIGRGRCCIFSPDFEAEPELRFRDFFTDGIEVSRSFTVAEKENFKIRQF